MLTEKLGFHSVAEMEATLGNDEYLYWRAYHVWLAAQKEIARGK